MTKKRVKHINQGLVNVYGNADGEIINTNEDNSSSSKAGGYTKLASGAIDNIADGINQYLKDKNTVINPITNIGLAESNEDFLSYLLNYKPMQQRGSNVAGGVATTAGATAAGAAAGSIIPGVGTAVGAAIGFIGGLGKSLFSKFGRDSYNRKIKRANEAASALFANQSNNIAMNNLYNQQGSYFAEGGDLNNNEVTEFNAGGTHEENPNMGIQLGYGSNGLPNYVEEGETRFRNKIFSNRLTLTKSIIDEVNLPKKCAGKTCADASKILKKEYDENPNDPISRRGLEVMLGRLDLAQLILNIKKNPEKFLQLMQAALAQLQLMQLAQLEQTVQLELLSLEQQPEGSEEMYTQLPLMQGDVPLSMTPTELSLMMAYGGNLYSSGIPSIKVDLNTLNEINKPIAMKPILFLVELPSYDISTKPLYEVTNGEKVFNADNKFDWETALRYFPVLGGAVSIGLNLVAPDPTRRYKNDMANILLQLLGVALMGNRMKYVPDDINYKSNIIIGSSNNNLNNLYNNSGGNRAVANSNAILQNYNTMNAIGNAINASKTDNWKRYVDTSTFNQNTDKYNMEALNRNKDTRINLLSHYADMAQLTRNTKDAAISANLTNLFNSIGGIGQENFSRNMVNSNSPYVIGKNGEVTFSNLNVLKKALKGKTRDEIKSYFNNDKVFDEFMKIYGSNFNIPKRNTGNKANG